MAPPIKRLESFMAWRRWKQPQLARAIGAHQTFVGRVLHGERRPGLDAAVAIERVTAEPREDGTHWADGPIRASEWSESSAPASPAPGGVAA